MPKIFTYQPDGPGPRTHLVLDHVVRYLYGQNEKGTFVRVWMTDGENLLIQTQQPGFEAFSERFPNCEPGGHPAADASSA